MKCTTFWSIIILDFARYLGASVVRLKKNLPEGWKSVYVCDYFKCDDQYHEGLKLKRTNGRKIQVEFLPPISKDPRDRVGKEKRRSPFLKSTGTHDPLEAVTEAIKIQTEFFSSGGQEAQKIRVEKQYSLNKYWEIFFRKYCEDAELKRNAKRNIRDTRNLWQGEGWGIKHQPFAQKSIDLIDANDLENYWRALDKRGMQNTPQNDMSGQKASIKTLLNKLIKTARASDKNRFGNLPDLIYPPIKKWKIKEEVEYFTRKEWDKLNETVIKLSGGHAQELLTPKQYEELSFNTRDRLKGHRNWVDLYDAMQCMWFFYLRAEDMPRLKSEWLHWNEELKFHQFYLEILKGNRIQGHTSDPYRICVPACERIKTRRPKGFIVFPMYERDESNPEDNQTLETCNYLLQHAVKVAGIKKRKGMTFTNIRHTAFFLMVSENREMFITDSEIETFAKNGHTSLDQFRDTYINKIDAKNLGKKVRKKTKDQVTKYELLKPDALVKNREAFVDLILSKMPERMRKPEEED